MTFPCGFEHLVLVLCSGRPCVMDHMPARQNKGAFSIFSVVFFLPNRRLRVDKELNLSPSRRRLSPHAHLLRHYSRCRLEGVARPEPLFTFPAISVMDHVAALSTTENPYCSKFRSLTITSRRSSSATNRFPLLSTMKYRATSMWRTLKDPRRRTGVALIWSIPTITADVDGLRSTSPSRGPFGVSPHPRRSCPEAPVCAEPPPQTTLLAHVNGLPPFRRDAQHPPPAASPDDLLHLHLRDGLHDPACPPHPSALDEPSPFATTACWSGIQSRRSDDLVVDFIPSSRATSPRPAPAR